MQFKKLAAVTAAAAIAASVVGTANAQTAYVNTFDLTLPLTTGTYANVSTQGASVTWWHNHTGEREVAVQALVSKFNSGNPFGITVEAINKGNYPDIYQAVLAGLQTKELPELTVAYQNEAATYQNANALVDLNTFVNDPVVGIGSDLETDFFQGFVTSDVNPQFGGQRLGFPVYRSMEVVYYNVDALAALGFAAPPKTWDEFKTQACKFVNDGVGTDGYQVRTDASFVAAAAFGQGADIYDPATNAFTYDTDAVKVMPTVIQSMVAEGCAKPVTESRGDQNSFVAGQSLFYIGSSSGIPFVASGIAGSPTPFAFDIAAIPYKDQPVQNVYGASVSIPVTTREQELAAWLFVRWHTEAAQQSEWAIASNYFPVRQSTADGLAEYFTTNKAFQSAFNLLGNTKGEPPVAGYNPVRNLASEAMNNIVDGEDVNEVFAQLNTDANALLEANQPGAALPTLSPTRTATPAATAAATTDATAAADATSAATVDATVAATADATVVATP